MKHNIKLSIAELEKRLKGKLAISGNDNGSFGEHDLNVDFDLGLVRELLENLASNLQAALLNALLLQKVWRNDMKVHLSVSDDLEEIQAAARSLSDLLFDYGSDAPTTTDFDNTLSADSPVLTKISYLQRRLRSLG